MSFPLIYFEYSTDRDDALHRVAVEWGIEREFYDIFGNHHVASAETEAKVLRSLGVDVSSRASIDLARMRRFENRVASVVPGPSVIAESDKAIELSLFAGELPDVKVQVALEDGRTLEFRHGPDQIAALRQAE